MLSDVLVGFGTVLDDILEELSSAAIGSLLFSLVAAALDSNVIEMEPEDFLANFVFFVLAVFVNASLIFATAGLSDESTIADEYEASVSGMRND